jgi:hypothetical protein
VALVERATELGGGDFHVASYDSLIERPELAGGPHDAVVLNFALFAEDVVPLLSVVRDMLAPRGAVVIQTVHPWTASVDVPYADGWRVETFDAFGAAFARPMPWYFRTLASWTEEIAAAGLAIERLEEPTDPASGRPLSLLLTAVRRAAR